MTRPLNLSFSEGLLPSDTNPISSYSIRRMTTAPEVPGLSFLRYVLQNLVEDPDELHIDAVIDQLGVLLTVRVSERDMGKLIGKGGQTVKALRTLLRVIGGNTSQRVNLKILEPDRADSSPSSLPV